MPNPCFSSVSEPASHPAAADVHDATTLVRVFNDSFAREFRTILEPGGEEPLYQPAEKVTGWHRIIFTRDYFASALHEVAHWCIAGPERRRRVDYGYWYAPDGRDREQQRAFEQVEVKPQALEWIFSRAAGFRFRLSADNLDGEAELSGHFKQAVWRQAQAYCRNGLPDRAKQFARRLASTFGESDPLTPSRYCLGDL